MSSEPKLPPLSEHPLAFSSLLDLITDTPLVEIRRLGREQPRARVWGKLESVNPGLSDAAEAAGRSSRSSADVNAARPADVAARLASATPCD
jgi:hypothetical protein